MHADTTWFAIQTRVGREQEARNHLQQQGFEIYLPLALQRISHARRVSWQPRAFLPGYLFAHLDAEQQRWTSIRSTRGVIGPVRFGSCCPPIREELIAMLKAREDEQGHIVMQQGPSAPFHRGERVRMRNGPMAGLEGVFACMKGEDRAMIFLKLLQREVQVTVETGQLVTA